MPFSFCLIPYVTVWPLAVPTHRVSVGGPTVHVGTHTMEGRDREKRESEKERGNAFKLRAHLHTKQIKLYTSHCQ